MRYLVAAALLSVGIAWALSAPGHGVYDWIRTGNYVDAKGVHCCGRDDCRPVGIVRRECVAGDCTLWLADGTAVMVEAVAIKPSEDGLSWVCLHNAPPGRVNCAFIGMGM